MNEPLLYWEDYPPGERVRLGSFPVPKDEIIAFARAFDPQPFHLDEAAAKASILGGLCASGWHVCALMMRLMCDSFLLKSASLGAGGVEEVRWIKPVYADDTITLYRTTRETRPSASNPALGLTHFDLELFNQNNVLVSTGHFWQRFARRDPGA